MYLIYDKLEEKKGQMGKNGRPYDCWLIHGMRKGFDGAPDTPYSKTCFDTSTVTVIEKGVNRPGCSLLQFFQKAAKPGDIFKVVSEREGNKFWRWTTISKWGEDKPLPTYEPLDDSVTESDVAPWD